MRRTGYASLPLHGGRAPPWLFKRMVSLAGEISECIVLDAGREELLRRLSDPYWFQAFSHVLGFDWHSSGVTTTACGALKVALSRRDIGIKVAGGKGKTARATPTEIVALSDSMGFSGGDAEEMCRMSRLSAKIDNTCVQDGFSLYHHSFILSEDGEWAVVQQGMSETYARRYHWLSMEIEEATTDPHTAVCSDIEKENVLNMVSNQSKEARKASVDLVKERPERLARYFGEISGEKSRQSTLYDLWDVPHLAMPPHHEITTVDIGKGGMEVLRRAYELQPSTYEELLLIGGMGAKKIRALALLSDLLWGAKASWQDPVKYSFSHGGKDGYPFPVDRDAYDNSIETLRNAIEEAKCGRKEKLSALRRLSDYVGQP
ncbi:MAG: DUF763 domain-containing protein [Methermicoccaceae archaeon]